jgi:CarD family transcriptional regulator
VIGSATALVAVLIAEGGLVETRGELGLAVGDVVVYGSHGVGRVAIRGDTSVVVEFATSGLTVTMPIECAAGCIRPLSTPAEIASVGRTLRCADTDVDANWQRRLKATRTKVTSGEAVALAEVVRDANRRDERGSNQPGSLSLSERQLYLKARQLLAHEIAASRGVEPAYADEWIGEQMAANAKRALAPSNVALQANAEPSGNRARRRGLI